MREDGYQKLVNEDLREAAFKGDIEGIRKALKGGAEINHLDVNGNTPLMMAIFRNNTDAALYLLKRKADPFIERNGENCLAMAASAGLLDVAKSLLKRGLDVNNQHEKSLSTPLMNAVIYKHFDIMKTLVENGANIELVNKRKNTAITIARHNAEFGRPEFLKYLIEKQQAELDAIVKTNNNQDLNTL